MLHGGEVTAYEMLRSVKGEAHRGLVNSIPTMLRHLRMDGISDPSLFLRRDRSMEILAGDLLRSFFSNLDKNQDMAVRKTREICAWRAPHVLACAIANILEFSDHPIILNETAVRLLAISSGLRTMPVDKRIDTIADILEEMPAWRFEVLATFVCFLRDCRSPNADLAREIGPLMLLRDGVTLAPIPARGQKVPEVIREQNQVNDEMAASEVFKVMIDECGPIFGLVEMIQAHLSVTEPLAKKIGSGNDRSGFVEEKSLADEEKASNSSLQNLYEGIGGPVPRRRKSKKASEFHNIIARTASNLSRYSNLSDGEANTPVSILKNGGGSNPTVGKRGAEALPRASETGSTLPAKPPKPSGEWQDRRPPPVSTRNGSNLSGGMVDSPLIQTQSSFPVKPNGIAIKTQTSFSSNNPIIKTQTSFNNGSRPNTPTALISAKRNMLAEIQANGETSRPSSPAPPAVSEPPQGIQRPIAVVATTPPKESNQALNMNDDRTPGAYNAASRVSNASTSSFKTPKMEEQGFPVYTAMSNYRPIQTANNDGMDADGPSIFERELFGGGHVPARHAVAPSNTQEQPTPPNAFEDELRRRTLTAKTSKPSNVVDQEEKSDQPANPAPLTLVVSSEPEQPPKPPKPAKRPSQPRHSFIPRITSPRRSEGTGKSFAQDIALHRKELEEEEAKAAAEEQLRAPSEKAAGDDEHGKNSSSEEDDDREEENQGSDGEEDPEEEPTPVLSAPPKSFAEQLAARRSIEESSAVDSTGSTKAQTFEQQLAARRVEVETSGTVVEAVKPVPKRQSFAEQLAARKNAVEAEAASNVAASPKIGGGKTFQDMLAERKAASEGGAVPNKEVAKTSSDQTLKSTPTPPFQLRPKPKPPSTEGLRRASLLPTTMSDEAFKRGSMTILTPVPPSPQNNTNPNMTVEDKLANLRALLRHNEESEEMPPAPSPPPEDTKKRAPPPDSPPPPHIAKLEREGAIQIVGDWRTEYSPQYKAMFWLNLVTGQKQWNHPMRERSLSTKEREVKAKAFAPDSAAVITKMPEARRTVHDSKVEAAKAIQAKREAQKSTGQGQSKQVAAAVASSTLPQSGSKLTLIPPPSASPTNTSTAKVATSQAVRSLESIGRQSSSEVQKNMHQGYRRASIQTVDFQAQQSAQVDEAEFMVIAAARAAGESIAECVFDFTPLDPNNKAEMAIRVGEKLRIYEKGSDGWWGGVKISDGRQRGLFPEVYVKLI